MGPPSCVFLVFVTIKTFQGCIRLVQVVQYHNPRVTSDNDIRLIFLLCNAMESGTSCLLVSVCLSVRMSHSCIVEVSSHFYRGLSF